jgi:hypothetical protein
MCCILKNDVPEDWMQHCGERRIGFLGYYSGNPLGERDGARGVACFLGFNVKVTCRWQMVRGKGKQKRWGYRFWPRGWVVGVARLSDEGG